MTSGSGHYLSSGGKGRGGEGRGGEGVEDFGSASQIFFRKLTANELPMRGGGES